MPKNYTLNAEMGVIGAEFNTPDTTNILHIKAVAYPQYRFEWHPNNGVVFVIRVGGAQEIAEPVSDMVRDQGTAEKVVGIWCQGYHSGEQGRILGYSSNIPIDFTY
jgi:hypothetical protein